MSPSARTERQAAFANVYASHGYVLRRWLVRRGVGDLDLDDLIQDVFLQAWCARGSFAGRAEMSTWLFGVAHFVRLGALRRERVRSALLQQVAHTFVERGDMSSTAQMEARLVIESLLRERERPERLEPFFLRAVQGMSDNEIAARTGRSRGAARLLVHRGRKSLEEAAHELGLTEA